jgi:hypothetical protein
VPQLYKNVSLGNWVKYNRHKMREWDNSCCSHEDKEKMKVWRLGLVSGVVIDASVKFVVDFLLTFLAHLYMCTFDNR